MGGGGGEEFKLDYLFLMLNDTKPNTTELLPLYPSKLKKYGAKQIEGLKTIYRQQRP